MTQLPAPRSRAELMHRAREEARHSMGRSAFVRDARVLPFGLPLAVGLAALAYAAQRPGHHSWRHPRRRRSRHAAELAALGTAAGVLGATVAASWLAGRVEWTLRQRAWDRERGW